MKGACHVVKDSPQPQVPLALGLMNTNSDLQPAAHHKHVSICVVTHSMAAGK